ncbi:hypothetical protein [Corynebacterium halotolerans]|uniref:Uncharacterized protein n=1 Tax=Corynebacterium halotolerans YIM 70093 = DSM 44683 TaxID=1121362 RepID=M1NX03_9CORY|nr:hypothetical protein [Corynebacterium halotolerans]AGF72010.1 hypothetical protein A605_05020 [Corynebacterium halotolerans YIM 70093 = DSM 44683]
MSFLNRPPDPRGRPDRRFPPLSARRADQLRRELADTVTARGGRLEIAGTTARILRADAGPVTVDLAPLITALAADDSPHAVPARVESLVKAVMTRSDPARMDTGDVYACLRVRLLPTLGLDAGRRELLTRTRIFDFTADTAACLALAAGRGSRPVGPAELAGHDDVDTLAVVGTRNLRAELARAQVRVDLHDLGHRRPGEYLWTVASPNPWLGSAPLVLGECLARWLPEAADAEGVLFAMPTATLLLLRPVTAGEDLVAGVELAALSAHEGWLTGQLPLSPLLHLWRDGAVETVSGLGEDERIRITPGQWLMRRARGG